MLANKNKCTGCSACYSKCPSHAITMIKDEYGFKYPSVDPSACIHCNLCEKSCPAINENKMLTPNQVYAATNIDKNQQKSSSSSGVFYELSKYIINNGGVVYGAAWTEEFSVSHIMVDNLNDLQLLRKSKYTQSEIGDTYSSVLDILKTNRLVLFSGTSCQIAGLYCFLGKDYNNLITVSVICHGVPSNDFFKTFLKNQEKLQSSRIVSYDFRYKDEKIGGYITHYIAQKNRRIINNYYPWQGTSFSWLFMNALVNRESCYDCKYADKEQVADVTLGDFWGAKSYFPSIDDRLGVSLILVNTLKGQKYINVIRKKFNLEVSSMHEALECNPTLRAGIKKPNDRELVLGMWRDEGYQAVENYYRSKQNMRYKYILALKIRQLLPTRLYKLFKR